MGLSDEQIASLPQHGGNLAQAVKTWGLEQSQWLDLSTGINPQVYPLSKVPAQVWQNLPYEDYGLASAATSYYQQAVDALVPGSQMAIETLPQILPAAKVALPSLGYNEYAKAWQMGGHELVYYDDLAGLQRLLQQQQVQHCVIINPNNPSGLDFSTSQVQALLPLCSGFCVVDEAFRDVKPAQSLLPFEAENLIVLRSLGKFFGLAGVRLGFVFMGAKAKLILLEKLKQKLSLWSLPGPSLWAAQQALSDTSWQQHNRAQIESQSLKLSQLLKRHINVDWCNQGLFLSAYFHAQTAFGIYQGLAQSGILIRYFHLPNQRALLRFGLPDSAGFNRLESALATL